MTNDQEIERELLTDPDPFGVLGLVVSAVAMFAQLVSLKIQISDSPARQRLDDSSRTAVDKLKDAIEDAIRNVENIVKILSRASQPEPLLGHFEFGSTHAYFVTSDFDRYKELILQLSLSVGQISTWTLQIIRLDQGFAAKLGSTISSDITGIVDRINRLVRERPRNEVVLEECLDMLRAFAAILDRLDRKEN